MHREHVVRAMAGDHDAFSILAASATPSMRRTARRILRDPQAADDAVQDALVSAWLGLRALRDPDRFEPWLHRLTSRSARRVGRRKRDRLQRLVPLSDQSLPPAVDDGHHLIAIRDQLNRALARLTARHRSVLVLRYHLDLPVPTAARVLGIPLGTAKSRLSYAQRALRAAVDADDRRGDHRGRARR